MDTMKSSEPAVPAGRSTTSVSSRRVFAIAGIGTALEYYDFLVYGLAAGLVFNVVFFPSVAPAIGTLYAFAAFGTGFFARPLGGIVIGHFGDKVGRRRMLVLTLVAMGFATLGIGILPTYEQIGVLAPALLVILRLIQGFAAGGEFGGAALFGMENAPPHRRGLWGSFTSMGIGLGVILGVSVFTVVSAVAGRDGLVSFAWRIPFLIGGVLVIVGLIARLSMPSEDAAKAKEPAAVPPLLDAVRTNPRAVLAGLGVSFGYNTVGYIGFTFFLSYMSGIGYSATDSLVAQLAYGLAVFVAAPLAALASDRWGRRPVLMIGTVLAAGFLYAFFPLVGTGIFWVAVAALFVVGTLTGIMLGPIPTFLSEQFSASTRYSGMSASYQLGAAIGGGTASFIATALLIAFDNNPVAVSAYGSAALVIVLICTALMRETSFRPTSEINSGIASGPWGRPPARCLTKK